MTTPCAKPWRQTLCGRPADHAGLHSDGTLCWGFRDPFVPEWRKRPLPAKDYTYVGRTPE